MLSTQSIVFLLYGCKEVPPVNHGGMEFVVYQYCEALQNSGVPVRLVWKDKVLDANYCEIEAWTPSEADHYVFGNNDQLKEFVAQWGFVPQNCIHMLHYRSPGIVKNVVSPSRYTSLMPMLQRRRVIRIPHPLYLDRAEFDQVYGEVDESNISAEHSLPDDYLFCAARVCKVKNVRRAMAIAEALDITLVWAGPVEDRSLLERMLKSGGIYLGDVPRSEVLRLMKASTAALCVTEYFPVAEAYGLFQVEAFLVGARVITSGSGGLLDTIYPPNAVLLPNFVPKFLIRLLIRRRFLKPLKKPDANYIDQFSASEASERLLTFMDLSRGKK